ncbi:aldehyde dehydrogenase family protein [Actinoplanes sp. NPDC051861]|uniref:aldehyde dehydrogenase family protein n=1 Tax=Actinoplanes sp. NPDC051861 TaxID=3155170 RepID=UPI003443F840
MDQEIRAVRHHVGGVWADGANGRTYDKRDPWTGEIFARVAAGDADDAQAAIGAAQAAFPDWSETPPAQRQGLMLRAAEILARRRDEVRGMLAAETGCGVVFATIQLDFCVNMLRQAAGLAYAPAGQILPSDLAGTRALAMRRPVGVVGAIAPWNASLVLAGRAVVAPIAVGNTVVLKPSEEAPLTGGALWAEILAEAGLPAGVLNVVTHAPGEAGAIAETLIQDPRVRRMSFTGSTVTGRRLAEQAGRHLKRMVLQLGGHNPLLVLADADLSYAVDAATYGAFVHTGQTCMCARRIIVDRSIAAEFTERFVARAAALPVGDPSDPATIVGPVINEWALSLLERRVREAVGLGARLLTGGVPAGRCFPPTVLSGVPPEAELAFDETFGPVVLLEEADGTDDALRRANATDFGLTAGVITGDPYRGLDLARHLQAGIVHVNDQPVNDEPQMPFGGVKDSGAGRFGMGFAAEEFTQVQWVTAREGRRDFPF